MGGATDAGSDDAVPAGDLETLRARLDRIDERLLGVLDERLSCCAAIAEAKQRHGVPMMQPHRIGVVQRRAALFAAARGIDPEFLRNLYDLIIAETCRLETAIMGDASAAVTEQMAGARGSDAP
jgi:chorismate mutase